MTKFLVVHPNLDIYGGGERVCHHVMKALVTHGQNVELLAFDFDQNRYTDTIGEKLPEKVVVHTLGSRASVESRPRDCCETPISARSGKAPAISSRSTR